MYGLILPEFDLIEKYLKPLANDPAALGLSDDTAVFDAAEGHSLVFSKDMMASGVHFATNTPAELIAQKLLRTNLSDLAAMGAKPVGYLLGISLPMEMPADERAKWMEGFSQGLEHDQKQFELSLLGGDTITNQKGLVLSITIIGEVPKGQAITRGGAKVGDVIMVSGTLGDGAFGLLCQQGKLAVLKEDEDYLLTRLQVPSPRVALGQKLRGVASSAIDVSDGLLADMRNVLKVSHVGAELHLSQLPLSNAAQKLLENTADKEQDFWPYIYAGGDDYELLFTVPASKAEQVKDLGKDLGVMVSEIGLVTKENVLTLLDDAGLEVKPLKMGYEHFG